MAVGVECGLFDTLNLSDTIHEIGVDINIPETVSKKVFGFSELKAMVLSLFFFGGKLAFPSVGAAVMMRKKVNFLNLMEFDQNRNFSQGSFARILSLEGGSSPWSND